jgi:hypothetical protein
MAVIFMAITSSFFVFRATKHVKSDSAKNTQESVAATAVMPKVQPQATYVEPVQKPAQTNDPMVFIDQGATVTFSSSSKVQPPVMTEKQVLAMQSAAKLAAITNKR